MRQYTRKQNCACLLLSILFLLLSKVLFLFLSLVGLHAFQHSECGCRRTNFFASSSCFFLSSTAWNVMISLSKKFLAFRRVPSSSSCPFFRLVSGSACYSGSKCVACKDI